MNTINDYETPSSETETSYQRTVTSGLTPTSPERTVTSGLTNSPPSSPQGKYRDKELWLLKYCQILWLNLSNLLNTILFRWWVVVLKNTYLLREVFRKVLYLLHLFVDSDLLIIIKFDKESFVSSPFFHFLSIAVLWTKEQIDSMVLVH